MTDPRKAVMADKLASLQDVSAKASGELAEKSFGLPTVWAAMQDAATQGFAWAFVEPPKAIDMRRTTAWQATVAQLKAWGFEVEEVQRPGRETWATGWGLLVRWRSAPGRRAHGGELGPMSDD